MLLIGLTGSIGMGKSETAKMFARLGLPVYDADAAVHALYAKGGAGVQALAEAFPGAVSEGAVDRARLSAHLLGNPAALKRIEQIIHPLVHADQFRWLEARAAEGCDMVVLDIPLLLEGQSEGRVDVVVVVSAPAPVQRARVLARPGMTAEKLELILAKQMPDAEKRKRAEFVIDTSRGLEAAFEEVRDIVAALGGRAGKVWPPTGGGI